jgi:hypothetical protein
MASSVLVAMIVCATTIYLVRRILQTPDSIRRARLDSPNEQTNPPNLYSSVGRMVTVVQHPSSPPVDYLHRSRTGEITAFSGPSKDFDKVLAFQAAMALLEAHPLDVGHLDVGHRYHIDPGLPTAHAYLDDAAVQRLDRAYSTPMTSSSQHTPTGIQAPGVRPHATRRGHRPHGHNPDERDRSFGRLSVTKPRASGRSDRRR